MHCFALFVCCCFSEIQSQQIDRAEKKGPTTPSVEYTRDKKWKQIGIKYNTNVTNNFYRNDKSNSLQIIFHKDTIFIFILRNVHGWTTTTTHMNGITFANEAKKYTFCKCVKTNRIDKTNHVQIVPCKLNERDMSVASRERMRKTGRKRFRLFWQKIS